MISFLHILHFIGYLFLYTKIQQIIHYIRTNAVWSSYLDKDHQMYQTNWALPDLNSLQITYSQIFGAWTRYQPLSNIQPLGFVKVSQSNCSLVSVATDSNLQINLLYYICFQYTSKLFIHKLKFFSNSNIMHEGQLIINSDEQYENTWYLFQVQYYPIQNKIFALITNTDASNYQLISIFDEIFPFKSLKVQLQIGGSLIVNDPLFPEITLLNSFQGIIYVISLQKEYYNIQNLDEYALDQVYEYQGDQCYENNIAIDSIILDQILQIDSIDSMLAESSMSGWFKLTLEADGNQILDFLALKPNNRFIDKTILDILSIQFSYLITQNTNQLKIQTYSYDFPLLNLDFINNNPFFQSITIDSELSFQQWHIIQLSNRQNYQEIKLIFLNGEEIIEYQRITNFNQFTGHTYQINIGSFLENNNLLKAKLQIYSFQFNNCQSSLNEFNLCHYSCLTCNGPTQFNCQSCSTPNFRQLNTQYGTCQCLLGYMEMNEDCISNLEISIKIKETQIQTTTYCEFGYFIFEGNCIECPQVVKGYQINCMECILNPQTWANILKCSTYSYTDDQSVYSLNSNTINKLKFSIIQSELLYLKGCLKAQSSDKSTKIICISCDYDYQLQYGKCQKIQIPVPPGFTICDSSCLSCSYSQICYSCNDPINYYVSANEQTLCYKCLIVNCKYCVDYSLEHPDYNSYSISNLDIQDFNYDDIVVGCSKCYPGFQFNFDTIQCEPVEESSCIQSIVKDQNQICLQTKLSFGQAEAIQYSQCQEFINHCKSCIIDKYQSIFCLECEDGYYATQQSGVCHLCEIEFVKTCYDNSFIVDYEQVIEVQAFYAFLVPDDQIMPKNPLKSQFVENPSSCISGYEIYGTFCIKQCPISCKKCEIILSANVCVSCEPNSYGIQVRSVQNKQCLQCPQYCEFCVAQDQDLIKKWNPYFNQDIYLTNRCLKVKEDLDIFYLNPQFGFVEYCSEFNQCILEAQINHVLSQNVYQYSTKNYEYYNFRSINSIFVMNQIQENMLQINLDFSNFYKSNIYSVNQTKIQIDGNFMFLGNPNITISSYNYINIKDIDMKIITLLKITTIPLAYDYIDFYLSNSKIYSQNNDWVTFSIQLNHLQVLFIDSVLIDSISVRNQIMIIQLPLADTTNNIKIVISNFSIKNCIFENTTVFNFNSNQGQQIDVLIQNLTITNITLIKSQIFNFASSDKVIFTFINTIIQNSILNQSKIFVQPHNTELVISGFIFNTSLIFQSSLYEFNTKITMSNIKFMYLEIYDSILFQLQNYYEQNTVEFILSNFIFEESSFSNISIFDLYINSVFFVKATFQDIQHINIKQIGQSTTQTLYVLLNYISLKDQLASYSQILISNFSAISDEQNIYNTVKLDIDCNYQPSEANLFQIQGFQKVILQNMLIKNQLMIDSSILKVYYQESLIEPNILISDINFISNILLKVQNDQNLPFISITADIKLSIFLENVKFTYIFINYYIQQQMILGNLININCIQGIVKVQNISLKTNLLSNSTSTMISIIANSIQLANITANNVNNVDSVFFYKYFNIYRQSESLQNFYKQLFETKSSYGLGILTAQDIRIIDSIFVNVASYSSSIFTIIGKYQFTILFENIRIVNATSNLVSHLAQYGCFYIDASTSQSLNLSINMIQVNYAINKLESGFLTVNPSNYNNKIFIKNSIFFNVFSLKNSVFNLNLGNSNFKFNKIMIMNITIHNQEKQFFAYLKLIQQLESYEINQLSDLNGIFLVSSSLIKIDGLQVTGYFHQPILQLTDCNVIQLFNLNLIKIFITQSLIIISSNSKEDQNLKIYNLKLYQVEQILKNYNQNLLGCPQQLTYSYSINQYCQIDYGDIDSINEQNQLGKSNKCDNQILAALTQKFDGMISISYKKVDYINLGNLIFIDTQCSSCGFGFLNLVLEEYTSNVNLYNIKCQNNLMSRYGCVYLKTIQSDAQLIANSVKIHNSVFSNNECDSGCAIIIVDTPVQLINTIIINNSAFHYGGGILYLSKAYNMIMQFTYFIDNVAVLGSAVFIDQEIISDISLSKIYVQNNDNTLQIHEQPSQIGLYLSEIKIHSLQYSEDLFYLTFPDYSQISSTMKLEEYILIPSNQFISEYQRFNSSSRIRQAANMSVEFRAENQYNEDITKLINTKCILLCRDYNITSKMPLDQFENFGEILFDNMTLTYNLGKTLFVINPYQSKDIVKQIQLQFPSIYNQQYRYLLNLRSYFCQIGEYFVDNGCQLCQVQKGYFSVKANQSICQQQDINKIKDITESEIQLYEGYWRPQYDSDQIEVCVKKLTNCKGGWQPGEKSCETGHVGALCEECDLLNVMGNGNYLKVSTDQQCLPCSVTWRPIISIVLLSLWSILSINLIAKSMEKSNTKFHELQRTSRHYVILHKFNTDQAGCLIKIGLNQMLVISSIFTYQIGFQVNLSFIMDISQATLSNSYNLDCVLADYSEIVEPIYLRIIVLFIIPLSYYNIYLWQYLILLVTGKKERFQASKLYTPIIYMFVITQPDIIKYCGSLLASRTISGIKWIQFNVSYLYETQRHDRWMYFCILPILFFWCIGIPLYFAYQLYKNRGNLKFRSIRVKYCYLFTEYKESTYYWEIVKIIQRLLQIIVLPLFDQNIIIKSGLLLMIQSIYLLILTYSRPFNSEQVNKLELKSVILCLYIIIVAVCMYSMQIEGYSILLYVFQVLLIFLVALNLIPIFLKIIYCYINQYFDIICIFMENVQKKYPKLHGCLQILVGRRLKHIQRMEIVKARFASLKQYLLQEAKQTIERREQRFPQQIDFVKITETQKIQQAQSNIFHSHLP